jgi:LuxR family transcriptional regulator, maltose regulon positive regulatory protein
MLQQLNTSKISPPHPQNALPRPRLIERLEKNQDSPLIFILGQAAQGKSTLAASYASTCNVPSAWVNLEEEDGDPVNLFYSLVYAFQNIFKHMDFSQLLSYPAVNVGPREENLLFQRWVSALIQLIPRPVNLILDGLDCLSRDARSLQLIKILVRGLPRDFRLIMLSRKEPPLELESLKVRQMAKVISNQELAFSPDETKAFFRELKEINLTVGQIKKIHQFTEGWTGGLVLLSETLGRLQGDMREKFISEEIPSQFKGEVFKFFGEAVFGSQTDSAREFLIHSSILETIEPAFVKDLLGAEHAEKTLLDVVRKNLFVESIYDEQKGWVFRYHRMFRDFLKARFMAEVSPEVRQALFLKTASLCEERGDHEKAIKYYLDAKAYYRAIRVMEQIGMNLWRMGRTGDISEWLRVLPSELLQDNPWLLLFLSLTRRFTEVKENSDRLERALKLFEQKGDTKGQMLSLAFLIEASTLRGNDVIPLPSLIEKGEKLVQVSANDPDSYETAILWFHIGFSSTVRGGNPRKGLWACEKANLLAIKTEELPLQINALIHALGSLTYLGEFTSADALIGRIESALHRFPYPEFTALYLINLSWLKIFRGEFAEAEALIKKARTELEENGLIYLYPYTWIYDLLLKPRTGKYQEAEEIAGRLLSLSSALGNLFIEGVTYLLLGMSYYRKGDHLEARNLLERCESILSSEKSSSRHHLNACHIMLNLIAFNDSEDADREENLRQVLAHSYEFSVYGHIVEAHLALALVKAKQNKLDEAVENLQKGLKQAQEQGYDSYRFLSSEDLMKACLLAVRQETDEAAHRYAEHLLSKHLAALAAPALENLMKAPDPGVRKRAGEILRKTYLLSRPPLKIKTFGRFGVLRRDVLMESHEWKGTQSRLLLQALLSHGSKGVPIEVLMDELWAEKSPDAASKRFKSVLHRLRTSLEPDMDKRFRSSYLILKGNRLSLDMEMCEVDFEKFQSLLQEGESKQRAGNVKSALSCYEAAHQLYDGDFLIEESYAEWAQRKRQALREQFVGLLLKMARIYEDRGSPTKAVRFYEKSIQTDPVLEVAYQRLMTLYADMGKRSEALKLYEKCREAMLELLDTEPDSVTHSIYKRILGAS